MLISDSRTESPEKIELEKEEEKIEEKEEVKVDEKKVAIEEKKEEESSKRLGEEEVYFNIQTDTTITGKSLRTGKRK